MGKMHAEGVTLIELLVTIAVLAVLAAVGAPVLNDFIANNRMSAAVNDVVSTLHLARSEAIKRRRSVTLCASLDWQATPPSCAAASGIEQGWIVFVDANGNATVDPDEEVLQSRGPLARAIADNSRAGDEAGNPSFYVSFAATGFRQDLAGQPAAVSHIQLCDERGALPLFGGMTAGRWVQVSPTGRPRVLVEHDQVQHADNPLGGCS